MKTVIFDFDGTIADSLEVVIAVAYHLTAHPRLADKVEIKLLREHQLIDIAEELKVPKYKWPYLLFKGRRLMGKRIGEIEPFPGIDETIKSLNKSGYNLLLVSSNSAENIALFLKNNKMGKYFSKTYGGVGLLGKTRALKRIMAKNKFSVGETIYIGDEPRDIEAARNNNMPCISVGWGYNAPDLLAKHSPFYLAKTPSEIVNAIRKWDS